MACNCATQEQIEEIYKVYGEKMRDTDSLTVWEWVKRIAYFVFSVLMYIIVFPIMFVYVILVLFWNKEPKINVDNIDFIKLKKKFKNKVKQCQIAIEHIE